MKNKTIKETIFEVTPTSLLSEQQSCGTHQSPTWMCCDIYPEAAWCFYLLYSSTTLFWLLHREEPHSWVWRWVHYNRPGDYLYCVKWYLYGGNPKARPHCNTVHCWSLTHYSPPALTCLQAQHTPDCESIWKVSKYIREHVFIKGNKISHWMYKAVSFSCL